MINNQPTRGGAKSRKVISCAVAIAAMLGVVPPVAAADLGDTPLPTMALEDDWAGHWLVRARAAYLLMEGGIDRAHLSGGPTLPGTGVHVSNQLIPELDISYFVTNNIAVEVICCLTKHDVKATGALGATINGITGTGAQIADTWAIPATLLLQYHMPMQGWKPYVGAGPTYAWFVDEEVGAGLRPIASKVNVHDSWGFTLQAGADVPLGGNWLLNFDAKYMFLEPDVTWTGKGPLAGTNLIADNLHLDPWILSVGLGYKF